MTHVSESGKTSYVLHDESGKKYEVSDTSNGDVPNYSGDEPYPEMTKEHLLRHSSKPLWRTLRTISIVFVIASWLALIAATIAIIVIHPRCKETPVQKWWQKSTIYRIYIRSFQDSDGNGIGDLQGVSSRLDYLKRLGVDTISLSAFYKHDESENEYSVLDHTAVHSDYGTQEHFDELVAAVHEKDMRLILDFIPGTTSTNHPWFTESSTSNNKTNPYRNYYIWNTDNDTPNNWLTVYSGGSAWNHSSARGDWYLHQFLSSQPSLNLRNYQVQDELKSILEFWLMKGADGFYIRNSAYLFVDPDLRDDPIKPTCPPNSPDYNCYTHERTFGLPEINDMFSRWRYLLAQHTNDTNEERLLFADIPGTTKQRLAYYGQYGRDGVDFPLGDDLLTINSTCDGKCIKEHLDELLINIPADKTPCWRIGSEDTPRLDNRSTGSTFPRALTLLSMLLPGTTVSYYGDEIGMSNSPNTAEERWQMEQAMRSPMQWTDQTHAGFTGNCSACIPWVPVNSDYPQVNVKMQEINEGSMLVFYQKLTKLRKNPSVQYGGFRYIITNENILSFQREFDGQSNILVAINFGTTDVNENFQPNEDVTDGTVEIATHTGDDKFKEGESIPLDGVTLRPGEGVVLSWDYEIKQY